MLYVFKLFESHAVNICQLESGLETCDKVNKGVKKFWILIPSEWSYLTWWTIVCKCLSSQYFIEAISHLDLSFLLSSNMFYLAFTSLDLLHIYSRRVELVQYAFHMKMPIYSQMLYQLELIYTMTKWMLKLLPSQHHGFLMMG